MSIQATHHPLPGLPPPGEVPETMLAQVVRQDRLGQPHAAFAIEEVGTPAIGPDEVLIAVMAAGINFNNVWAAKGIPVDVIAERQRAGDPRDFRIGGSDASGIVYAVGTGVTGITVGDEVLVHHGWWRRDDPWVLAGRDPMTAPSAKIWGYQTNYGAFAQFTVAQAHQCLPKPAHLSWEEAAAATLVGTTAYRMLFGWVPNQARPGDVVLIWGGSGGLGTQAIQLAAHVGSVPVAVVPSQERGEFCQSLGAAGFIDRREFDHWGIAPHWTDAAGQQRWTAGARAFGKKIWDIVGEKRGPAIVVEHPGEATIPTSIFVCEPGGWWSSAPGPPATQQRSTCAITGRGKSACRAATDATTSRRVAGGPCSMTSRSIRCWARCSASGTSATFISRWRTGSCRRATPRS